MKRREKLCAGLLAAACCWLLGLGAERQYIRPDGNPTASPVIVTSEECRIHVAAQAGAGKDLAAQTRRAIQKVRTALSAAGATSADVVRLDIHFLLGQDPEPIRRVLQKEFPAARMPNQLMLPVGALAPSGSLIQISALAARKRTGKRDGVVRLSPSKLPHPHGNAAVSIAQGRGVFYLSGQSDTAIGRHESITDMGELTRRSMRGLSLALQGSDAQFTDVASTVVYVSSLDQLEKVREVYRSYFEPGQVPPTSYVARSASENASAWVEIDAEAVMAAGVSPPTRREWGNPPGLVASRFYTYVVRPAPGRTVYVSAQTAAGGDPEAQTQAIYEGIERSLRAAGARFEDVVKVRAFPLPSKGVMAAINAVRMKYYVPGRPPASTLLGWDAAPVPGAVLQVDAIAVMPAGQTEDRDADSR